jgi:hypothetical protein
VSPSTTAVNSATRAVQSASSVNTPAFWERLWHTSGIQFAVLLVITCILYGSQPGLGAPSLALVTFSGNNAVTLGLHDFAWALVVLSSFPRAMLIMAGTFGLWRAGLISNALFGAGVTAVVLGVLGGTTWFNGGLWAPDGPYSRFIFPTIGIVWIVVVTRVLLSRKPAARAAW